MVRFSVIDLFHNRPNILDDTYTYFFVKGGGKRFDYPKYVWSPSGGWWCEPRNWRRNTAIGFGMMFAACIPICWLSWQLEVL